MLDHFQVQVTLSILSAHLCWNDSSLKPISNPSIKICAKEKMKNKPAIHFLPVQVSILCATGVNLIVPLYGDLLARGVNQAGEEALSRQFPGSFLRGVKCMVFTFCSSSHTICLEMSRVLIHTGIINYQYVLPYYYDSFYYVAGLWHPTDSIGGTVHLKMLS